MQTEILNKVIKAVEEGHRAALVFITEKKGSIPGAADSMMAVFDDGKTFGTIGGGPVEYKVTEEALEAIRVGRDRTYDHNLTKNSDTGMLCGGNNKGYIKVFKPKPKLIIYGAGHVGQKLARVATKTNFDVIIVDDRSDFKDKEDLEEVKEFLAMSPKEASDKINFTKEDTFIVICTPNNDLDVLRNVIEKDYKYIGMIGSRHKVKSVFDSLRDEGIGDELLNRVYSPVGLDIDNGTVEEIAISILSEILAVKNGKKLGER